MSSQAHRRRRQDAAKKRRGYLLRRCIVFASIPLAVGSTLGLFLYLLKGAIYVWVHDSEQMRLWWLIYFIGMFCAFLYLMIASIKEALQKADFIPYVLPVAEQIACLPADAILVRGSTQPDSLPGELLRAAYPDADNSSEELLRAESRKTQ